MKITLDFESRSAADLRKVGVYEYARHPSTKVLCLAYTFDNYAPVSMWWPGRSGSHLAAAVRDAHIYEAHNAMFERLIWEFIMVPRHGFPPIRPDQWRCSAAKAAAHALPKKLEKATAALDLRRQKDMAGHRLMLRLSKENGKPIKRKDFIRLLKYCVADVRAERELSNSLRDLSAEELAVWRLDQAINLRGVAVDTELARKAISLSAAAVAAASLEFKHLTDGAVSGVGERAAFIAWMKSRGVKPPIKVNADEEEIETTEAKSLRKLLKDPELKDETVRAAVKLWIDTNKSSTTKYISMIERAGADGRVRDAHNYHAASTGRWAGRGIQPQNLPRPAEGLDDTDELCEAILSMDYDTLEMLYGG